VENRVRGRWRGSAAQRGAAAGGQSARTRQYALLEQEPPAASRWTSRCRVPPASTSLIIVYALEGPAALQLRPSLHRHRPGTTGAQRRVHVYGGDRVRISNDEGPRSLADALKWTPVRIVYNASKGLVETSIDGRKNPSLRAADFSLGAGRIGLGSFFNTGSFRKFELRPGAC